MTTTPHGPAQRTIRDMYLESVREHVVSVQKTNAITEAFKKRHPEKPEWEILVMLGTEADFTAEIGQQHFFARKANMYGHGAVLQELEAQRKVLEQQTKVLIEIAKQLQGDKQPKGRPLGDYANEIISNSNG